MASPINPRKLRPADLLRLLNGIGKCSLSEHQLRRHRNRAGYTIGDARPEEKISLMVRDAMTGLGFTEIMSLLLQSVERHFSKFNLEPDANHVIVENPKTIEQKVLRNHMNSHE